MLPQFKPSPHKDNFAISVARRQTSDVAQGHLELMCPILGHVIVAPSRIRPFTGGRARRRRDADEARVSSRRHNAMFGRLLVMECLVRYGTQHLASLSRTSGNGFGVRDGAARVRRPMRGQQSGECPICHHNLLPVRSRAQRSNASWLRILLRRRGSSRSCR